MIHFKPLNRHIVRTIQTPHLPTGEVVYIDDQGTAWRKDYSPQYEVTGEIKGKTDGRVIWTKKQV